MEEGDEDPKPPKRQRRVGDSEPILQEIASVHDLQSLDRWNFSDFNIPCLDLAKKLLGQLLVARSGLSILSGVIVEVEAYPGKIDNASHSFQGKKTAKNEAMFSKSGTAYVYCIHGYAMLNICSQDEGGAVLLRAARPVTGQDVMVENRRMASEKRKSGGQLNAACHPMKLCSGPGKLTMSFGIDRSFNFHDICASDKLWIVKRNEMTDYVSSRRIGINSAGLEAVNRLYRFHAYKDPAVSKRDLRAEKDLDSQRTSPYFKNQ